MPYGFATLLLAFVYLKFMRALAPKTRNLFLASAALFLSGAIGMEIVSSVVVSSMGGWETGFYSLTHANHYSIEEPLEMVGVVVFIYALLDALATGNEGQGGLIIIRDGSSE